MSKNSSNKGLMTVVVGLWVGVLLGAVIIGVLALSGVIPLFGESNSREAPLAKLESGIMGPEVPLNDLQGNTVRLSDYRGRVVVLNFWATWCIPCIQEIPLFQEFQDRYPQIAVIGVNEEEPRDKVSQFVEELGITYPIWLDSQVKMARELRISMLPTTIILDEKGEIRFRHYGLMSEKQLVYYLKTLGAIAE